MRSTPFSGDIKPSRVSLFTGASNRPTLPFPHPWNFLEPLRILETFFHGTDDLPNIDKHNRYLDVPGFAPVLVTRDPRLIRSILADTGADPGQFERDTLPSRGIARATGKDTLLYANGKQWRRQKQLAMPPFGRTSLFQPEQFQAFAETFRQTVRQRLAVLEEHVQKTQGPVQLQLQPEIQAVMLEMLVNNFFGAEVDYETIRNHYVPSLERVIDHIVSDTVINKLGLPLWMLPRFSRRVKQTQEAQAAFENLTNLVLASRPQGKGLWNQFKSDAPDDAIRSNIRVFLAGALEATTSYASWAISHLARNTNAQEKLHAEVCRIDDYTPEALRGATYLDHVLDETLRLTPSLYFLPRRATAPTWVTATDNRKLFIPRGTHILLDVWHANRREDHWGAAVTGHPAADFVPERWEGITPQLRRSHELLHFGFGHGPRICPGTHLGHLEVALVVGAFVKLFRFKAVHTENTAKAGVSTKPADGALVELERRDSLTSR